MVAFLSKHILRDVQMEQTECCLSLLSHSLFGLWFEFEPLELRSQVRLNPIRLTTRPVSIHLSVLFKTSLKSFENADDSWITLIALLKIIQNIVVDSQ